MWERLRSLLELWGLLTPLSDRLTLRGRVRTPMPDDPDGPAPDRTVLSVSVDDSKCALHVLARDGRFRLELPMHVTVKLTFVHQGHLPRMVEIQPRRSSLRLGRDPVHASCELDLVLTPRQDPDGSVARPLMERITMPKDHRPLIVEWDFLMRREPNEGFIPLFARVG